MIQHRIKRREFVKSLALTGGAATGIVSGKRPLFADDAVATKTPRGKATACIVLWMGGGMCHLDTLDPKPLGDPAKGKAGSAYEGIATAVKDVQVCEHLSQTAARLDRGVLIRSVHHPLHIDHADSSNLMKTGRLTSGTIVYPSLGSVVSHELGPGADGIPSYVVIGYPNLSSGPGFLGSRHGYIYLSDTKSGPTGLQPPNDVDDDRLDRRIGLLRSLREEYVKRNSRRKRILEYDKSISNAIRLTRGSFPRVFQLDDEPQSLRDRYGSEFGQRCLLARRLVGAGVRFVEVSYNLNFVNGTGWDTHRHGQKNQHVLIQDLDRTLSTLLDDLKEHGQLDSTLVLLATEFGRPAKFDNGGGRGHQSSAFSVAMFGGGLKTGQVVGRTDDLAMKPVEDAVSVADLHATIHAALGIDPRKELYAGDRPVPINDHGRPLTQLFG